MSNPPTKPFKSSSYAPQEQPSTNYPPAKQSYDIAYTEKTPGPAIVKNVIDVPHRFKTKMGYTDKWAALLFLVVMATFGVLFGIGSSVVAAEGSRDQLVRSGTPFLVGVALISGFGLSLGYFLLMNRMAGRLIKFQVVAYVVMMLFTCVLMIYQGRWAWGFVTLAFAILFAFMLYLRRHHIPFAKVMLESVTDIIKIYPSMIVTGVIGMVIQMIFCGMFITTLLGVNSLWAKSESLVYAIDLSLLFVYYWFNQVAINVCHVTCAGVFATFYFTSMETAAQSTAISNPCVKSAKRALTSSFGSICYGSLLIAIIKTIRAIVKSFDNAARRDGNCIGHFFAMIFSCVLAFIESLMKYFNHYAFTYIAVYGHDYCSAGKDVMALLNSKGMDAIINDDLIGICLTMGAMMIGLLNGVITVIVCLLFSVQVDAWFACVIAICIGYTEFSILCSVITSGTATTFVCLAEDPEACRRTKPALFEKVREAYPAINFY